MGTASFAQNSFLGGEWSPQMQGRFDREDYRQGMNLCLNVVPIEEGAAPRRSGTRLGGPTRNGSYGVLREYNVDQAHPYDIELTDSHMRLWITDAGLVTTGTKIDITAISSADPAVLTSAGHGLATGDQVIFTLGATTSYDGVSQLLGRQLAVTVVDVSNFEVTDALTGATVDGTTIDLTVLTDLSAHKILDLDTPYVLADLQQVRIVQDGVNALLLHKNYAPKTLVLTTDSSGSLLSTSFTTTSFHDGPYLDIPTDGTTLTPSALSGTITFTFSAITSVNSGDGLQSTDVGRMFRVFSEPALWAVGTAYVTGNIVKEADVYWKAVQGSTGVEPSTDNGTNWVIDTTAAAWTWGTITSVVSTTVFHGVLAAAVKYPENTAGGNLLYTVPITAWQLGTYSNTTGYPSTGAYYQGRIWLGGAVKNRFDACVSNDFGANGYINFAPTGLDGTVSDSAGISGTLNAREIENFLWMLPDEQGILAGTQSGEWIIASSSSGEPITPTSIQAREITHYGSINMPAIKVGRATIFVDRDTRKVYEYMANYFTQKFVADNLTLKSKHLTVGGVAEIAYMRELTPVIWCRLTNGGLIGCTYKHDDPIKPMEFNGWHQHQLGTSRNVISIQGGPANGGETDTLAMVTQDSLTSICYVEFLQTLWDDSDDLMTAWYVDGASIPVGADRLVLYNGVVIPAWSSTTTYAMNDQVAGSNDTVYKLTAASSLDQDPVSDSTDWAVVGAGSPIIRIYGLWYIIGQSITAWGAGLDLGDFTVSAGGTIDLPLNAQSSLFTDALLAEISAADCLPRSVEINA